MKILLINIDSKLPNIALLKIEKYHLEKGDLVFWDFPLMRDDVEKIYVSCLFDFNRHLCEEWEGSAEIGGTGYDIDRQLPPEIERINVKVNYGFTSRGCIRDCDFCVVRRKEGKFKIVGDLYNVWDGKSKEVVLMDNNILADKKHFFNICDQAIKEKIKIDFNSGFDFRLLDDEFCIKMKQVKIKEYRFAFDTPDQKDAVIKAIEMTKRNGIKRAMWYVLVGYRSTHQEDIERIQLLKDLGQRPYAMRYKKSDEMLKPITRWACNRIFHNLSFNEYLDLPENKYYKKLFANKKT